MNVSYSQTKKEQRKDLLFAYYHRPIIWFQRRFLGPFVSFVALFFIFAVFWADLPRSMLFYVGFLLLAGIYNIVRPLLYLRGYNYTKGETLLSLDGERFLIRTDQSDLRLKREDILKIWQKKNYLVIKARMSRIIHIFINLDPIQEREAFVEDLETFSRSSS